MSTYEQRELAGTALINQPALPTESKHTLDDRRDEARLHRIEAKELRLLNNEMVPYNKNKELTDTLWNPRDNIMKQLNSWNYKIITNEEAMHVPYRRAS